MARFQDPDSIQHWEYLMNRVETFLAERKGFVTEQMHDYFLSNDFSFTIKSLYPTPAQDEIRIETDFDKTALTSVQIFDLNGRERVSMEWAFGVGENEIVLPIQLPAGVYVIRIGDTTRKFVVIN